MVDCLHDYLLEVAQDAGHHLIRLITKLSCHLIIIPTILLHHLVNFEHLWQAIFDEFLYEFLSLGLSHL